MCLTMWWNACQSSTPSTNNRLLPSDARSAGCACTISASANLDLLTKSGAKILRWQIKRVYVIAASFKAIDEVLTQFKHLALGSKESADTVGAVSRGKDLNSKLICSLEEGSPKLFLHFPVQAVLEFVDKQDSP